MKNKIQIILFLITISNLLNSFLFAQNTPCTAYTYFNVNNTCTYQWGKTESCNDIGSSCTSTNFNNNGQWIRVEIPATGSITIVTDLDEFTDGMMAAFTGSNCSNLTEIACDDNSSGNYQMPMLTFNSLTPGDDLWILVWEKNGTTDKGFKICFFDYSILPVTFTQFDLKEAASSVEISWTTATETNNDYFVIQKSLDTDNWEDILTVNGKGNSNSLNHYSVLDSKTNYGKWYYRIKQVDYNTEYSYSKVKSINLSKETNFDFYTHFTDNNTLNISLNNLFENEIIVEIYNMQGILIRDYKIESMQKNLIVSTIGNKQALIIVIKFKENTYSKIAIAQ
jgi:hypothetical protein